MNILHVNFDVDRFLPHWIGGVPSVIQNIMKYTETQEIHHYLLTPDCRYNRYKRDGRTYIIPLDTKYILKFLLNPINSWNILKNIDVVHFHHSANLKIAAYFKLVKPSLKIVETIYTKPIVPYSKKRFFINKTIAIDKDIKQSLIDNNYPRHRIEILPIVPDFDKYDVSTYKSKQNHNRLTIWFSAGPRKEMGLFYLLEEITKINKNAEMRNKYRFIISIVDQPHLQNIRTQVKNIINKNKLDNVKIGGYYEDVPNFMSKIDIIVYPILKYVYKMNTPLMVLEGMLMEKLIITTPKGGVSDVVDDSCGILFDSEKEPLSEVLLALKRKKILNLQKNARNKILDRYPPSGIKKKYEHFYGGF